MSTKSLYPFSKINKINLALKLGGSYSLVYKHKISYFRINSVFASWSLCLSLLSFCSVSSLLLHLCTRMMVISGDVGNTVGEKMAGVGDLCTFPPNHSVLFKMSYQHFLFLSSVSMVTFLPSLPSICHLLFYFLHLLITCYFF